MEEADVTPREEAVSVKRVVFSPVVACAVELAVRVAVVGGTLCVSLVAPWNWS